MTRFHEITLADADGGARRTFHSGELLELRVHAVWEEAVGADLRCRLRDARRDALCGEWSSAAQGVPLVPSEPGALYVACRLESLPLPAGDYAIDVALAEAGTGRVVVERAAAARFFVHTMGTAPVPADWRLGWETDPARTAAPGPPGIDRLESLQVESSSFCDLRCRHCYKLAYPEDPPEGNLPPAVWARLCPALARVGFVDLGGWGEPLLNPRVFEYAREARAAGVGCVMFSTHAGLLDERRARALIGAGVTDLNVSIDGAAADTHAALRDGSDLATVRANLARLARLKREAETPLPRVHGSFVMSRANLPELPAFIDLMADVQAAQVVLRPLIPLRPADLAEVLTDGLYPAPVDRPWRDQWLDRAIARARARELVLVFTAREDPRRPGPRCFCNAHASPFVQHDGTVSPCCFLAYPVDRVLPEGRVVNHGVVRMGSLAEQTLDEVWNSADYRAFRARHVAGTEPRCAGCPARHLFVR